MPNHLAGESSPYLLQHVDNPVDWYPWGKEALERAAREDKPIFLSIGYSACHWCHVMERESFTDATTAELLNRHFISIKVDREERPDLDAIYMDAVSALTGGGGWPLSVWLTPEGAPFYGGTYFPERARYGMPSFKQVLQALAEAWAGRREELEGAAGRLVESMRDSSRRPAHRADDSSQAAILHGRTLKTISSSFDPVHGGWGSAPKFPQPVLIDHLLTRQALEPDPAMWTQIEKTLDAMAAGGIFDHLGGGFHRYSTDDEWLVPHFEKMLYDNALLARSYLHAWQLSGKERYRRVCEETLDYLLRDMRHTEGAFFSSEDADSEGEEGRFFVWTADEIDGALPPEEAAALRQAYGVTAAGNFEGRNILHLVREPAGPEAAALLAAARTHLVESRDQRVRPGRDEKILASWNGLALAAFADAARVLDSDRYLEAALSCGSFLVERLVRDGWRISHSWKDGRASAAGFLEDHALVADGLLALYEATFDERWYAAARGLLDAIPLHFTREGGGFYDTSSDHEALVARPRSLADTPLPSGNAAACMGFLRLAAYTGDSRYLSLVDEALPSVEGMLTRAPSAFAHWLTVHYLGARGLRELAIVGRPGAEDSRLLAKAAFAGFRPDLVVAGRAPGTSTEVPLLQDREPGDQGPATAWLCRQSSCLPAITEPDKLLDLLAEV